MSTTLTVPATRIPGARYFHGRYWLPVTPTGQRTASVARTGTTPRTRTHVIAMPLGMVNGRQDWALSSYPRRRPAYAPRHAS